MAEPVNDVLNPRNRKIFISPVSAQLRRQYLDHFAQFGEIESDHFPPRDTFTRYRFAFVEYKSGESAEAAISKSEHHIDNNVVHVKAVYDFQQPTASTDDMINSLPTPCIRCKVVEQLFAISNYLSFDNVRYMQALNADFILEILEHSTQYELCYVADVSARFKRSLLK